MTPFEVTAAKAQPTRPDKPVRGVIIHITDELPANGARRRHIEDASAIATALCMTLPGATLDHLLALLLEHRASELRVARGRS